MTTALKRAMPESPSSVPSESPHPAPDSPRLVPPDSDPSASVAPRERPSGTTFSLRWVVPAVAAAVLATALLFAGMTWERDSRSILIGEVEARLLLEARHLALVSTGALLDPFPELTLQPLVRDMLRGRPDLATAVVLDNSWVVQGTPDSDALKKRYSEPRDLERIASPVRLGEGEELKGDVRRIVAIAPVLSSGERIGTAIVTMHRAYLDQLVGQARQRRLWTTLMLLAGGTLVMLLSIALLLRPVAALRRGIERLGRGDLGTPIRVRDRTEFGMLAETLNHMAEELREAQRIAIEQERLTREMELARNLQRSLLPADRHSAGEFVLVGAQEAATEVGGDYYDVIPLESGRVGFAIADVAGKGLGGCLIMTMLSALLRGLRDRYDSPSALLVAIERSLRGSLPRGGFVSMTYCILDPSTGSVVFASAGHLPAMIYRASSGAVEWHRAESLPIGALRKGSIETMLADQALALGPGDLLVQITDGYSEAPAPDGEHFDFPRIEAIVRRHGADGSEAVIRALDQAVRVWAPSAPRDDRTILVVGRDTAAVRSPTPPAPKDFELSEPLALIRRLERRDDGLTLQPQLEELARIRGWLREHTASRHLDADAERFIVSALYETCANMIEHGLAGRRPAPVDVWWLSAADRASHTTGDAGREVFVLRDHGNAFDLSATHRHSDDAEVRKRRRGLGLEMIQRIATHVAYAGGTPEGNVTVLEFDLRRLRDIPGGSHHDHAT